MPASLLYVSPVATEEGQEARMAEEVVVMGKTKEGVRRGAYLKRKGSEVGAGSGLGQGPAAPLPGRNGRPTVGRGVARSSERRSCSEE